MHPQISCPKGCIVTLVAFHATFLFVFKCYLKGGKVTLAASISYVMNSDKYIAQEIQVCIEITLEYDNHK